MIVPSIEGLNEIDGKPAEGEGNDDGCRHVCNLSLRCHSGDRNFPLLQVVGMCGGSGEFEEKRRVEDGDDDQRQDEAENIEGEVEQTDFMHRCGP